MTEILFMNLTRTIEETNFQWHVPLTSMFFYSCYEL